MHPGKDPVHWWGVHPKLGCSIVFIGCSVELLSWNVSEFEWSELW